MGAVAGNLPKARYLLVDRRSAGPEDSHTMSLAWDIRQHFQSGKAKPAAETARNKIDRLTARRDNTKEELVKRTLACRAMREPRRDHLGFTDEHLQTKVWRSTPGPEKGRARSERQTSAFPPMRTEREQHQTALP